LFTDSGLLHAFGREAGIRPAGCRIAVFFRPEAVPAGHSVIGLNGVAVAFAVAAHVEDFVFGIWGRGGIEGYDLVGETLPLGFVGEGSAVAVGGVVAGDEAEIGSSKDMDALVSGRLEATGHCRVVYVGVHRGGGS
jgi:hypothetical protein